MNEGVDVRLMLPATRLKSELPRWEVSISGRIVGWIEEHHIGSSSASFFFATRIHPQTGRQYSLEGSTDFDERVEVVRLFDVDPMTSRQHLGLGLGPAYRDSEQ